MAGAGSEPATWKTRDDISSMPPRNHANPGHSPRRTYSSGHDPPPDANVRSSLQTACHTHAVRLGGSRSGVTGPGRGRGAWLEISCPLHQIQGSGMPRGRVTRNACDADFTCCAPGTAPSHGRGPVVHPTDRDLVSVRAHARSGDADLAPVRDDFARAGEDLLTLALTGGVRFLTRFFRGFSRARKSPVREPGWPTSPSKGPA